MRDIEIAQLLEWATQHIQVRSVIIYDGRRWSSSLLYHAKAYYGLDTDFAELCHYFKEGFDYFVEAGDIIISEQLLELLTLEEAKAVLAHEIGHLKYGQSEIRADIYTISCGYGKLFAIALHKMYKQQPELWDMKKYSNFYCSTPANRIACLMEEGIL